MVVGPVRALTDYAGSVGARGEAGEVPGAARSDELGTLARSVRDMLRQLEDLRAESVALSRDAGKAEVAAGVLHNVGNAVNNVGVLVDAIAERAGSTKTPGVAKVAGLLEKNAGDLPALFAKGGAGEQLPAYVSRLSEQLAKEGAELSEDLKALREGLAHVRQIVASHEGLAAVPRAEESMDLRAVAEASVLLVGESLKRHGVELSVAGPAGVVVRGDRSSLTQVLVNLLTNAKEALAGRNPKAITVRVSSEGVLGRVEVSDNGPGVPAEARDQVFRKGYTTKQNGHGIGLHHSWVSVRDMGGALTLVESGAGATFRVDLPAAVAAGVAGVAA
jgi:signal transduction histidine kinase